MTSILTLPSSSGVRPFVCFVGTPPIHFSSFLIQQHCSDGVGGNRQNIQKPAILGFKNNFSQHLSSERLGLCNARSLPCYQT